MLWFTLLIALSGILAGGYGIWQQMRLQQITGEQQVRIIELEQQLSVTDNASTQSLAALTANLNDLDQRAKLALAEVDKLWATRNVNRKAIDEIQSEVDNIQRDVQSKISTAQKKVTAAKAEADKALAAVQTKLNRAITTLRQQNSEQELLLQSLREQLAEQNQVLVALAQDVQANDFTATLETLTRQLQAHDEAIESMDKFRVVVNRDLLTLKQRGASGTSGANARK